MRPRPIESARLIRSFRSRDSTFVSRLASPRTEGRYARECCFDIFSNHLYYVLFVRGSLRNDIERLQIVLVSGERSPLTFNGNYFPSTSCQTYVAYSGRQIITETSARTHVREITSYRARSLGFQKSASSSRMASPLRIFFLARARPSVLRLTFSIGTEYLYAR